MFNITHFHNYIKKRVIKTVKIKTGYVIVIVKYSRIYIYIYIHTHTHDLNKRKPNIMVRTTQIAIEENRWRHIGYSFRLAARVLLYASSHRQDNTYHGLCYTCRGALPGTRNSSMGPPHNGSIRQPIAPWANALTTELHLAPIIIKQQHDVNMLYEKQTLSDPEGMLIILKY